MSQVFITKINKDLKNAALKCFNVFGGVSKYIPKDGKIFIKINNVHYTKNCYTTPDFLGAILDVLIDNGADPKKIFVIENCTSGLFTRLVMNVVGITKVIKERGANYVYMDEDEPVTIQLGKEKYEVQVAKIAYEELIKNREKNVLISLPVFKTHWATKITLSIKLSLGYLFDSSKAFKHHYYHRERLVDIFEVFTPDISIIEGKYGIATGPCPPDQAPWSNEFCYDYDILFAGIDGVALDAVGAKLLGFENLEVDTTRIAHERGLGIGDINKIKIIYDGNLEDLVQKVPWRFAYERNKERCIPPNVRWFVGQNEFGEDVSIACHDGCYGLTLISQELFYQDYGGKGNYTMIFGKNVKNEELEGLIEPILLMGSCAVECYGSYLKEKYNDIWEYNSCAVLGDYADAILKANEIEPLSVLPFDANIALYHLMMASLHGIKEKAIFPIDIPLDNLLEIVAGVVNNLPDDFFSDEEFGKALKAYINHKNPKIRTKAQVLLSSVINNKKLEKFKDLFDIGLKDTEKKVIKSTLKAIKSLKEKEMKKSFIPQIQKLTENDDDTIQKLAKKVLEKIQG
ncbi:MAG: DUF362 domain-containing protein [Candidatus Helarchaeota archaeon]